MEVAKFREYVSRLQKVQIAVNELLIKRGPGAGEQTFFESADTRDPIEKCLAEAEKLVNEGKVMAAMQKQAECEKLIGRSTP